MTKTLSSMERDEFTVCSLVVVDGVTASDDRKGEFFGTGDFILSTRFVDIVLSGLAVRGGSSRYTWKSGLYSAVY